MIKDIVSIMSRGCIMAKKVLFSIGETAKIHRISKQSLIFYDKIDLLKPCYINPDNGYRYYSLDEFAILDIIIYLKTLDAPLEEIKQYILNRNVQNSIEFFNQQKKLIEDKIQVLKDIKLKLTNMLELYDAGEDYSNVEPFIKKRRAQHSLQYEVEQPQEELQTDLSLKRLIQYVEQHDYLLEYSLGTTVSMDNLAKQDFSRNERTFVIVNKKLRHSKYRLIPAGNYATIYHHGAYGNLGRSYERLLEYINANGFTIKAEAYEYLLFDIFLTRDKRDFLTEISILVD